MSNHWLKLGLWAVCTGCVGVLSVSGCSSPTPSTAATSDAAAPEDGQTSSDGEAATDGSSTAEDAGPACTKGTLTALGKGFFVDMSDASGIRVGNVLRNSKIPVPINDHSRLGFVDLDGDRLPDIVTHSLYPNPKKGIPFEHLIYRNKGDGTFEDFSDASGLRAVQAGFFAFADIDNDG
ncbi:MAG: VCBS repeat-containing protein, partial [Myxococcales bacterium]|nr:VCBS repeat-containing protein [Myxococcales bacterium]